jgi:tetratricopeptide (TPR) repeat protein
MKVFLFLLACVLLSATFFRKNDNAQKQIVVESAKQKALADRQRYAFSCGPDLALIDLTDTLNEIPLLQGWGNYSMTVTVTNDSARIYFEQGINMYYAFHIIEALASFDKAVKFDDKFAMGYWGKALSYGPNINDFGYSASPDALAATQKAKELSVNCTAVEKALIDAMQVRYSPDTAQTREYLNELYADAMMKVYQQFLNNADAAALYADALMVQHPWDLYDKSGKSKKWTPQIVEILEVLLKLYPDHPGACHYYIHAIEGSNRPERGLEVAARLPKLMPGVAHLVHMPSHIYIRSGYYKEGAELNEKAVKSYYSYLDNYSPVINNSLLYLVHNLHMQATCANMDGRFADALKISNDCRKSFDSSVMDAGGYMGVFAQYVYMTPYFTLIRFGKWDDVLNTAPVPETRVYSNLIWHYGRGLAYAREHNFEKANAELEQLRADMQNPQLLEHPAAFNPGIAGAGVAETILEGVIAEEHGELEQSITLLKEAVEKEDNMLYNEPKDWVHPARQYLGNVLIKANRYAAAEKVFREDLDINPNNGWSLTGIVTALVMQGKKKESNTVQQQLKTSFARTDTKIIASVF